MVAAAALSIWLCAPRHDSGQFARVRVNGEVVTTLDLRGGDVRREISGLTVCVKDGCVSVSDASCPDRVCVESGEISRSGQAIVCVPNRVSIEVVGTSAVDAVAGGM